MMAIISFKYPTLAIFTLILCLHLPCLLWPLLARQLGLVRPPPAPLKKGLKDYPPAVQRRIRALEKSFRFAEDPVLARLTPPTNPSLN